MQNADEKKEIIKMWCIAHFTAVCYNKLQPKKNYEGISTGILETILRGSLF